MMGQSVQCANFTAFVGEGFKFQTLDTDGQARGPVLAGIIKRTYRAGRRMAVDIYLPEKHCTHAYYARDVYYKGVYHDGHE